MQTHTVRGGFKHHLVWKAAIGLVGCIFNIFVWSATFLHTYFSIMVVVGMTGSIRRFNHSRGSIFDSLNFHSAAANPLQNAPIDKGFAQFLILMAVGLAIMIFLRTVMATSFRRGLVINMRAWSGGLAGSVVSLIAFYHLNNGNFGDISSLLFGAAVLFVLMQVVARKTATSLKKDIPADEQAGIGTVVQG